MTAQRLELEPPIADTLFGENIDAARAFVDNLARAGEERGLIGPSELPRLWSRHILNSVLLAPLLHGDVVGDIGSGSGLPGIVLAIACPDRAFVLIEPMERRIAWLREQVVSLDLHNVTLVHARAQDAALDRLLDQVTARAVTSLAKLIPLAATLLRTGGELVFMKGANVNAEVASAAKVIARFRLQNLEVLSLGQGVVDNVTRVVRATVE